MYWAPLFHEIFQNDRKTLKITKYIPHHSDVNNWSYLPKIFLMSTFKVFIEFFTILLAFCFASLFCFCLEACGTAAPWPGVKPLALEGEVLASWPPGKFPFLFCFFFLRKHHTPAKLPSLCSLQSYFPLYSPPSSILPPPRRGHQNPSSIFTLPIHVLILLLAPTYTHESITNLALMYI